MPDIDPSKVVAVLEDLFGPQRGRLLATLLAALACAALAVFFSWVIWDYFGRAAFGFVSGLLTPVASSNDLTAAAATLIWVTIIYGLAFVSVLYFLGRALFKRSVSQSTLDELARLRNQGIKELYAAKRPANDLEFADWTKRYQEWTERLLRFVEANFPEADFLSVEFLGVLDGRFFSSIYNEQHNNLKGQLAKRIEIIEGILASYRG